MNKKLEEIFTEYTENVEHTENAEHTDKLSKNRLKKEKIKKHSKYSKAPKYCMLIFLLVILGYFNQEITYKIFNIIINYNNIDSLEIIALTQNIFSSTFSIKSLLLMFLIYLIL